MLSLILEIPASRDQAALGTIPPLLCSHHTKGYFQARSMDLGFSMLHPPHSSHPSRKNISPKPWTHARRVIMRRGMTLTQGLEEIWGNTE